MPGHGKRYKFNSMTGAQISDELRALGLSVTEVSRLTGVNPDRLIKWINGDEPNPPQLFVSWLALMALDGAQETAEARSDLFRIDPA